MGCIFCCNIDIFASSTAEDHSEVCFSCCQFQDELLVERKEIVELFKSMLKIDGPLDDNPCAVSKIQAWIEVASPNARELLESLLYLWGTPLQSVSLPDRGHFGLREYIQFYIDCKNPEVFEALAGAIITAWQSSDWAERQQVLTSARIDGLSLLECAIQQNMPAHLLMFLFQRFQSTFSDVNPLVDICDWSCLECPEIESVPGATDTSNPKLIFFNWLLHRANSLQAFGTGDRCIFFNKFVYGDQNVHALNAQFYREQQAGMVSLLRFERVVDAVKETIARAYPAASVEERSKKCADWLLSQKNKQGMNVLEFLVAHDRLSLGTATFDEGNRYNFEKHLRALLRVSGALDAAILDRLITLAQEKNNKKMLELLVSCQPAAIQIGAKGKLQPATADLKAVVAALGAVLVMLPMVKNVAAVQKILVEVAEYLPRSLQKVFLQPGLALS